MENKKENILKKNVENVLLTSLNEKHFSGASLAVSLLDHNRYDRFFFTCGFTDFENPKSEVKKDTFFDLASLTKPLVTVLCLFILEKEKKISLNDPLGNFFIVEEDKKNIPLWTLLSHCSGFPAHREFFQTSSLQEGEDRKKSVLKDILSEKLEYKTGDKHIYSDLGFILLGFIIEKITGCSLDEYWKNSIAVPLGLDDTLLFRKKRQDDNTDKYVTTGHCPQSNTKLCGIVHDDNCRYLGGVAGHAGLFGTVDGVLSLCETILISAKKSKKNTPFYGLDKWLKRINNSNWCYGFDMVSAVGSSAGKYFSSGSIGHLGFTGCSFWIDIEKAVSVVFLTNRVLNSADNRAIKKIRPLVHNKIMEAISSF